MKETQIQRWRLPVTSPPYVMMSSDYSQQEPKLTAYISGDEHMIKAFMEGKDIYATIASLAFNLPYEKCLENHPETGEYQPDGKARRGEAKTIVLGITYGRSVITIADQLFGKDETMKDEEKISKAQGIYDAVLNAFPKLRQFMLSAQNHARKFGYVETILGRRRHLPDMQLPEFEFKAMQGYLNPDIDPLNPATLQNKDEIPQRIIDALTQEFKSYKYFGQKAKRMKELYEQHIKVINNQPKITEATRQCVNSIVQGSAAELTKMALIKLTHDPDWIRIGGRILTPIHDELLIEVPMKYLDEGKRVLSKNMEEAGSFLPFGIRCDVETTIRWYGMSFPCPYPQPESIDSDEPEEVKWIQYHLLECGYSLPIFKNEDGSKPRGDAAKGVNGRFTEEYKSSIQDYMSKNRITPDQFIDHIHKRVYYGK